MADSLNCTCLSWSRPVAGQVALESARSAEGYRMIVSVEERRRVDILPDL